jgi:hypothetical protein
MILITKSGLFDTVDKVCIVTIFVLLMVALMAKAYDEDR